MKPPTILQILRSLDVLYGHDTVGDGYKLLRTARVRVGSDTPMEVLTDLFLTITTHGWDRGNIVIIDDAALPTTTAFKPFTTE